MSRPDLSSFFMSLFWCGQGVTWVGVLCSFCVWFSIRDSCLSLSLIGNHTFPTWFLWVVNFCLVFCTFQDCFGYSLCYFVIVFSFNKESMNTYHAVLWSDDSSSSEDEYTLCFPLLMFSVFLQGMVRLPFLVYIIIIQVVVPVRLVRRCTHRPPTPQSQR